ncbi:hypothetical protein EUGRSUZ_C03295 [Eucalyptus grandis]|uniref:Uncharacterized protein n=2 Tax=Eucalyptus grandis TaxID=71139 RepID=A0ACC3LIP1_EUCGR|nr:hypothetical protein EUGRSUZ_C03295 [Eucalyptus grandis]
MASGQLTAPAFSARLVPSFDGLKPSTVKFAFVGPFKGGSLAQRSFRGLVVRAATVVAPKYTSLKPLGDRVLVKIKTAEEKTQGGILLPSTAQSKPQGGEVVAVGEGRTIGKSQIDISVKYAGTELEFNGSNHLILKEDDILGILETEDVKDLKPLNERILIKVCYMTRCKCSVVITTCEFLIECRVSSILSGKSIISELAFIVLG